MNYIDDDIVLKIINNRNILFNIYHFLFQALQHLPLFRWYPFLQLSHFYSFSSKETQFWSIDTHFMLFCLLIYEPYIHLWHIPPLRYSRQRGSSYFFYL